MWKSVCASILALSSLAASAQAELFLKPMHLTRQLTDSLSGTTSTIEEYYVGDRAISIRDHRTSIADYSTGELTEIDRREGTYSVTRFEAIAGAKSREEGSVRQLKARRFQLDEINASTTGLQGRRFRVSLDSSEDERVELEVTIDPDVRVSKDAFEVLTGSAWPLDGGLASAVTREAARAALADSHRREAESYGLPLELVMTWSVMGESVRTSSKVKYIGEELPPTELVAIPPGAREVISRTVESARLLEELDQLPEESRRP